MPDRLSLGMDSSGRGSMKWIDEYKGEAPIGVEEISRLPTGQAGRRSSQVATSNARNGAAETMAVGCKA